MTEEPQKKGFSYDHIAEYLKKEVIVTIIHKPSNQSSSTRTELEKVREYGQKSIAVFQEQVDPDATLDDFVVAAFDPANGKVYVSHIDKLDDYVREENRE